MAKKSEKNKKWNSRRVFQTKWPKSLSKDFHLSLIDVIYTTFGNVK